MQPPLVASLKRGALDDGPGLRTTVFFKGCVLACVWCHNPECIDPRAEIVHREADCLSCGACADVCPQHVIPPGRPADFDRDGCDGCGVCAQECPSGARERVGVAFTLEALRDELLRDRAFYESSGGGVTLSGGEATMRPEFVGELAAMLRAEKLNVLLQTCGDFVWDRVEATILPHVDGVWCDLKLIDAEAHRRHTGRDNERILANLRRLAARPGLELLVRVPLIPEITATADNLRAIAKFVHELGHKRLGVMAYNPLWHPKSRGVGRAVRYLRDRAMSAGERAACREALAGLELIGDL